MQAFYRRFIKKNSKITKPLSNFLVQGTPFDLDDECQRAFSTLKEKLIIAPIVVALDWNLPFELMCDASNYVLGAILGQWRGKVMSVKLINVLSSFHMIF